MEKTRNRTTATPRYLTFDVEAETYGIPILKVKEIVAMREITPLPQTPPAVKGVINLRGTILPVVDLRTKFGLVPKVLDKRASIVVLDLVWEGEALAMGVVVDVIREVQAIPDEKVSTLAGLETRIKANYVQGVADTTSGLRILIDVEKILTEDDMVAISERVEDTQENGAKA